jgi:divalent metal cation (Fe/Co/Zn/Cd) transporter
MDSDRNWPLIGFRLVTATLVYNALEAIVALWAGISAGSIVLVGFGLDSVIEFAAAAVLLWRLGIEIRGRDPEEIEQSEQRVHRFIGGTFIALALYVTISAAWTLISRQIPEESLVGIILAFASLIIMPIIAWWKLHVAARMGSAALRAEAKETLACSYLSFTLLLGLGVNALAGWWWADPVAALLMVPWLIKEGLEGLSGEDDD